MKILDVEEINGRKPILNIGDIVIQGSSVYMMIKNDKDTVNVVDLRDGSLCTGMGSTDDWLDFWDGYFPDYKIYPSSRYGLKLVEL